MKLFSRALFGLIVCSVNVYSSNLFPLVYEAISKERCVELAGASHVGEKEKQDLGVCWLTKVIGEDPNTGVDILMGLIDTHVDPLALHNFGFTYLQKDGFEELSLRYLLEAAKRRVPESMHLVSTLMLKGKYSSIIQDKYDEVLFSFSKGALDQEVSGARYVHALVLLQLYERFPEDSLGQRAESLLLLEAKVNPHAANTLGDIYKSGTYFDIDESRGKELIDRACSMGYEKACANQRKGREGMVE